RGGWPSPCWSRTRSTRRARRSREESRLHEGARRIVEALELLAAVLVLEDPSRRERIRRAQLGVARVARGEDVGGGRRLLREACGAVGRAAETEQEVALGLLALEVRGHARRVRPRRRGEHEPEEKNGEPTLRHRGGSSHRCSAEKRRCVGGAPVPSWGDE